MKLLSVLGNYAKKLVCITLAMSCMSLLSCSKGNDKTIESSKWMEGGTSLHNITNSNNVWRQGNYIYYTKTNSDIQRLYEYDIKSKTAIPVKGIKTKLKGNVSKGEDVGILNDIAVFGRHCALLYDTFEETKHKGKFLLNS